MAHITYHTGCRNCLHGDVVPHRFFYEDDFIDNLQPKTEYSVMTLIENFREESNKTCNLCGSKNVEIFDIELNDEKLYDFNRIAERCDKDHEYFLELTIDKTGQSIILKMGGSRKFNKEFLKHAFIEVCYTIINRPFNHFKQQQDGNMFICLTGGINYLTNQTYTRIETFGSVGLSKDQIIRTIKKHIYKLGISIGFDPEILIPNYVNLDFIFKSYSQLRYENGKLISRTEERTFRAVKVEPNNNGCDGFEIENGDGYIVTIFNQIGSNFPVSNTQVKPKPMRIVSQSKNKVILRGYQVESMTPFGRVEFKGEDYGMSIFYNNDQLEKCVLHLHARSIDIEYLP